jgi:hypothetical protein
MPLAPPGFWPPLPVPALAPEPEPCGPVSSSLPEQAVASVKASSATDPVFDMALVISEVPFAKAFACSQTQGHGDDIESEHPNRTGCFVVTNHHSTA